MGCPAKNITKSKSWLVGKNLLGKSKGHNVQQRISARPVWLPAGRPANGRGGRTRRPAWTPGSGAPRLQAGSCAWRRRPRSVRAQTWWWHKWRTDGRGVWRFPDQVRFGICLEDLLNKKFSLRKLIFSQMEMNLSWFNPNDCRSHSLMIMTWNKINQAKTNADLQSYQFALISVNL